MHKFYYGSLAVLILLLSLHVEIAHSTWWHWFAPAKPTQSTQSPQLPMHSDQLSAFDIESASAVLRNGRGSQLLEQAKKQTTEHTCWHHAYASLVSSCREILGDESAKTRLALKLVNCFLKVSGRPVLKPCPQQAPVTDCTAAMNDHVHSIFLAFFIDAASMCHHLQSEAFKLETELVINKLKDSAHWVEEKLQSLKQESETMIENSGQIIGLQEKLREEHAVVQGTINNMQASVDAGLSSFHRYATELNAQLKDVTHFQKDLADQQEKMAHQQHVLSKTIATDISALKQKANALGHSLEKSLVGQEELMVGQGLAITSLNNLHKQQVDALEESRSSLQELASEAKMHQAEFRIWQKELDRMQHDLAEGSASMLNAQLWHY
ncbi:hypothetical protein O6H91_17G001200 [Diphasiastrum complanatum]|uniref:Uncharacterized protein n=1 Tax=Diphasiastrum complanatum TaxID=34168 RepID=A0ACC2B3J8_DIPCM|nr:hypothetical protein O6H91_17G001200 [Diphasiastrum complanatum]